MKKQISPIHFFLGLCTVISCSSSSIAIDLDETTRTIPLDSSGSTVILTPEQVKRGKRLFNASCGQCHVGGVTKTNPNQ
jgi:photosystem II cytochrome c550